MKVLHVTDHYTPRGGVEQYILSVAQLLADHGHRNAVLYTHRSEHTIHDGKWPTYHVQTGEDVVLSLEHVLTAERPDVAYIHYVSSPSLIGLLTSQLPTAAYVHGFTAVCPGLGKYFRRGDTICTRPFGWGCVPMHYLRRCSAARRPSTLARLMRNTAALQRALLRASRILVGSSYMAGLLAQNHFPAEKIAVLPPHFLPDDATLTYVPPAEPRSVLYAGRLEIEKGLPYLLQGLAEMPADVRLVVAGDGTQRDRYQVLASELGLAERVQFLGWLDERSMESAYHRCGVVAIPSVCPESFGKAGVEALAHGRPVVAFDVGGISDWLQNGVNGFLVQPKDVHGLAGRIGQLMQDETLSAWLGQAGQAGLTRQYAASGHLATLLATFQAAMDSHD